MAQIEASEMRFKTEIIADKYKKAIIVLTHSVFVCYLLLRLLQMFHCHVSLFVTA